jgi:hypothetical protein
MPESAAGNQILSRVLPPGRRECCGNYIGREVLSHLAQQRGEAEQENPPRIVHCESELFGNAAGNQQGPCRSQGAQIESPHLGADLFRNPVQILQQCFFCRHDRAQGVHESSI